MSTTQQQMARAAARLAKKWLPAAKQSGQRAKQFIPTARQSGKFVKHVLPAAVKPIHSLWHEILGFIFLFFAGSGAFWLYRHPAVEPAKLAIIIPMIAVMSGYGISSIRKARRISRS